VIQDGLSTNVSMFVRSFMFIIASFVLLFYISWKLTLATIGCIIPVLVFAFFYGRFQKKIQEVIQQRKAECSSVAEETFGNVRTVKAFATEKEEEKRYKTTNWIVYQLGYKKALAYGVFSFFAQFFVFGSMCVIIYLGAYLQIRGEISLGSITSFLLYLMQLLINFMILSAVFGSIMSVIGASTKIVEILEHKPKINTTGGMRPDSSNGTLQLKNLQFQYPSKKDV